MKKMTHATRTELANAVRDRYVAATVKEKHKILAEFIAATGYHEKSAIRVLNSPPVPKRRQTRQRLSLYDEAAHFSDRRRSFQSDRGRDFSVIVDGHGRGRARLQS